jgi:SAM-dependent methyltransferase
MTAIFDNIIRQLFLFIKIRIGIYKLEALSKCPVCSHGKLQNCSKHLRGFVKIELKKCLHCGVIFQTPRLDSGSLQRFYEFEYRFSLFDLHKDIVENTFNRGIRRGEKISRFLEKGGISIEGKRIYEIGCGYGGILEYFKSRGCSVWGSDFTPKAVNYGRNRGLNLEVGSLGILRSLEIKPEIVILSHVLEHIEKPVEFLKEINDLIDEKTIVYVEIPVLEKRSVQIGHLVFYTPETLNDTLARSGLNLVDCNEKIQAVCSKLSL